MRRISRFLVVVVALSTLNLSAEPLLRRGRDRGPLPRLVRIIKAVFGGGVSTNGDGLTPPTPAPRP